MSTRRLKSSSKLPARRRVHFEMEGSSGLSSGVSDGNTIYCCIKKDGKIVYSYSSNASEESELLLAAEKCLEFTPPYHRWFTHTINTRTFGYLEADGCSYLAIVDPTSGSQAVIRFLHSVREASLVSLKTSTLNREIVPAVRQLLLSLANVPRTNSMANAVFHGEASGELSMPLLSGCHSGSDRIVPDAQSAPGNGRSAMSLERGGGRSSTVPLHERRRRWRLRLWIIVAVNVVLVGVLLAVWLVLCRGVECLRN